MQYKLLSRGANLLPAVRVIRSSEYPNEDAEIYAHSRHTSVISRNDT